MKNGFIFFMLLLCLVRINAQKLPGTIDNLEKKTETLRILNNLTATENFKFAKKRIAEAGIEISGSDPDIYQIKVGPVEGRRDQRLIYLLLCDEGLIKISGRYSHAGLGENAISNYGMKGSPSKVAFQTMFEFAKKFDD